MRVRCGGGQRANEKVMYRTATSCASIDQIAVYIYFPYTCISSYIISRLASSCLGCRLGPAVNGRNGSEPVDPR